MLWGTTRSIINSAIIGVSKGYEKILELSGVGFRANLKGNILNLQIGFSHNYFLQNTRRNKNYSREKYYYKNYTV